MQANYGENEIKALLSKVRLFDRNIGEYQLFAITESFDYAVKLSNGTIFLKLLEIQANETDTITADELKSIALRFIQEGSQKKTQGSQTVKNHPPPLKAKKGMFASPLTIVGGIIVLAVIVISIGSMQTNSGNYGSGDLGGNGYEPQSYEEKVLSVQEVEAANPTNFLDAKGTYRIREFWDRIDITCEIENKATTVSYKDVKVRFTYYTESGSELGTEDKTFYKIFPPTSTKTLETEIPLYSDVESVGWEVVSAGVY